MPLSARVLTYAASFIIWRRVSVETKWEGRMGRSSVAQSKGKADEGKGKGKKGPVGKKKMRKDDRNGIKAPETQEIGT